MSVRFAFSDFSASMLRELQIIRDAITAAGALVSQTPEDADVLVFGDYGKSHRAFVGTKVHYTSENYRPPWPETDFAVGFDRTGDPRYLRLPLPALFAYRDRAEGFVPETTLWDDRTMFCNFIYSRPGTVTRRALFKALHRYRPVTSPGRFLNNASAPEIADPSMHWRHSKIAYQRRFRFTIAAENGAHPGYTTEKLHDALYAGTIPIYWGDPRAGEDVDERAFIDCASFRDLDEVVEIVREIDARPELARPYLEARPFAKTTVDEWFTRTVDAFARISAHADAHRDDPATARRARHLVSVGTGTRARLSRAVRSAPVALSLLDTRYLGGLFHRVYHRLPGARRIARAIRGRGF